MDKSNAILNFFKVESIKRAEFFISWYTNPPTVIFWKVEKKKSNFFFILSTDSKYYLFL